MALFISDFIEKTRQPSIEIVSFVCDKTARKVFFEEEKEESRFPKNKNALIIDGSVHSGHSLLAVVEKVRGLGVKSVLSYSLIIKRGSVFVPTFFGVIIPDHDRAFFLLDKIPNNRIMRHGIVRRLKEADVYNPIQSLKTDVESINNTTWSTLWYESVAKGNLVYVHEGDNGIDGFISFLPKGNGWLFIDAVARDENAKGKGVGEYLIRWAETWARSGGYKGIELWALNERIGRYKKFDFEISEKETLDMGKEKYTRMYRKLLYHLEDCQGCRTD